jgi:senataxin
MHIACRCFMSCGSKSIFEVTRGPILIVYLYRQLNKSCPPGAHWFCPKRHDEDLLNYDDLDTSDADAEAENITSAQKTKLIDESDERLKIAYKLFEIYLFDTVSMEDPLAEAKRDHRGRSVAFLTTCDHCVRKYHMGRKPFLKEFSEWVAFTPNHSELGD